MAHFLGAGGAADAWQAAFRIPNFLQNLFGEGALSASFIPSYSALLGQGREAEARRVAGAVAGALALLVSVLVLLGILATPLLISLIAPGFEGERRALTITLVRIVFPGVGLLVLSAWCLGVLNSHGRFLLSYAAPVVWNAAIITALLLAGAGQAPDRIALLAAWGSVAGAVLQLAIQLPAVWRVAPGLRPSVAVRDPEVQGVARRFGPAVLTRGVTQVSSYVDTFIASFLPLGAVASIGYAQLISTLPVSLFGMSVAAAELPAMARDAGTGVLGEDMRAALQARLLRGMRRIVFLVVPSAVAFATIGHMLAAALFQGGRFAADDSLMVWSILAGSSLGVLAATMGRLYSSAYYALRDTRSPLRYAAVRVGLNIGLGWFAALHLPALLGVEARWGAAGLTAAAGIAAWIEWWLLRRGLEARVGSVRVPASLLVRAWVAALVAAIASWALMLGLALEGRMAGMVVTAAFGATYLAVAWLIRIPEARGLAGTGR